MDDKADFTPAVHNSQLVHPVSTGLWGGERGPNLVPRAQGEGELVLMQVKMEMACSERI